MRFFTPLIAAAFTCCTVFSAFGQDQKITLTIAGNGTPAFSGDGGLAKKAVISGPKDVCLDADENLYFTDKGNGRVRKITANGGIISTIAGGGTSTADGVPALTAAISPNYLCANTAGDIFITTGNQVRKIEASSGLIYTVAGTGTAGFSGDGGLAVSAELNNPQGIAIDAAGNLYIVDRGNNRVRKITFSTGMISTIAGTGIAGYSGDGGPAVSAQLKGPVCVCVNPAGDVFFSDQNPNYPAYNNSIIRKIDAATGIVTHIAGALSGGIGVCSTPALSTTLGTTTGMCIGPNGNLYCNEMSCSCRELDFASDTMWVLGGNFYIQSYTDDLYGPNANMNIPYGLCVDHLNNVYIADSNNQRIRKLNHLTHTPTFAFGRTQFFNPYASAPFNIDTLLWITDIDEGETEMWTVLTPPVNGVLTGFPAIKESMGKVRSTKPTGLAYTPLSTYTGSDMFRVLVSDGTHSDTVLVFVGEIVPLPPPVDDDGHGQPTTVVGNSTSSAPSLVVFPNPASSTVTIGWKNLKAKTGNLVISDIADRVFYTATLDGSAPGSASVDVSSFAAGVYMIRINGIEVQKFVKQ
ncbi:MAG: T9SS type A sorting domain-containing protein [Taibaiella sp.]|nr:T9SS type A sorting domain-containing protein [Taibaiella sp.]